MGFSLVLAGGSGSRLGGAKAGSLLDGRPLIAHVLDAARAGGLEPVVVAKADSKLPPLDCRVIVEPPLPRHPLCGIVTGLAALDEPAAVVCACDMPFVGGALLGWLATLPEPLAIAAPGGRTQPLLGRYSAALLTPLAEMLARELPMRAVAAQLRPRLIGDDELSAFGDPGRLCTNINTPAELAAAGG